MKTKLRIMIIAMVLIINLLLPGCVEYKALNELAFVGALSLDKTVDGKIEITMQIVNPNILKSSPDGGGSSKDAKKGLIYTGVGQTVLEAARNTLSYINRTPYYKNVQIIIISDELAKEGIRDLIDIFFRNNETNKIAYILISRDMKAKEVTKIKSEEENISVLHLVQILKNNFFLAKTVETTLFKIEYEFETPGREILVGVIERNKQNDNTEKKEEEDSVNSEELLKISDIRITGTAVFNKDKLIGWLTPAETRSYMIVDNKLARSYLNIPNPKNMGKKIALEIHGATCRKKTEIVNGNAEIHLDISLHVNIQEMQGLGDLEDDDYRTQIIDEVNKTMKRDIDTLVNIAQKKYNTDFLGFGEYLYRFKYKYWTEIRDKWDEKFFANIPVEANIETRLISSGFTVEPVKIK